MLTKRDRPPRWFPGKSCDDTAFEKQRVPRSFYSDRTNLQIDQDLHPEHGTLALVVIACPPKYLPASPSATYLMRSNWRLCSSQVLRPAKEWLDVTGTF